MSRAFGTSSRADRERRRRAVNFRKEVKQGKSDNVERVHNRRWMIVAAVICLGLLLWFHVI